MTRIIQNETKYLFFFKKYFDKELNWDNHTFNILIFLWQISYLKNILLDCIEMVSMLYEMVGLVYEMTRLHIQTCNNRQNLHVLICNMMFWSGFLFYSHHFRNSHFRNSGFATAEMQCHSSITISLFMAVNFMAVKFQDCKVGISSDDCNSFGG